MSSASGCLRSVTKVKVGFRLTALTVATALFASTTFPAVVLAEALPDPAPSTDHSTTVTSSEVAEALSDTAGILAASDQTKTTSDADSAIQAVTAGASVDIPKDASEGITLGSTDSSKPSIEISLPNAAAAADAKQVAPGTVAYPATNGSANAVQATEDGGVRMLTIIDNPNAPTAYDYKVTVSDGGRIELTEFGGAAVLDSTGQIIAVVDTPWAEDASGKQVNTYFTTDGTTLTQHVDHNVPGVVYPVTADPAWFVIIGAILAWAAGVCATSAIGDIGLQGVRWAIQGGDWYWRQKLDDALWACGWGIATGGSLRFAPASIKGWTASQIVKFAKYVLSWRL